MKKQIKKSAILVGCMLVLVACSSKENENTSFEIGKENEFYDQNIVEENVHEFVPDYEDVSEINFVGNTAGNLSNNGGVTNQGKWTYYYNRGEIKKVNADGEFFNVCIAPKARNLNVVGDWIYYFSDSSICRVRTDGSNQEVLISNGVEFSIFYVIDNNIYYLYESAISATSSEYLLEVYNVETQSTFTIGTVGNSDNFVGFNGYGSNCIYFKCRYLVDRSTSYYEYKEFKVDLENNEIICLNEDTEPYGGVAYVENDIFYKDAVNVNNGRVFNTGAVINKGYYLWYIDAEDYAERGNSDEVRRVIIQEDEYMEYICVIDDYVYYRLRYADYNDSSLYRVKIDGTEWQELL